MRILSGRANLENLNMDLKKCVYNKIMKRKILGTYFGKYN